VSILTKLLCACGRRGHFPMERLKDGRFACPACAREVRRLTHTVTYYDCAAYLRRRGYLIDGEPPPLRQRRIATVEIQRRVAEHYGIPIRIMTDESRCREHARPRQVAMYLTHMFTANSLPEIGRRFGGRDHTTVIHGIRRVKKLREENDEIDASVGYLIAELGAA